MTKHPPIPSSFLDQPAHVAGAPVALMAIEMEVSPTSPLSPSSPPLLTSSSSSESSDEAPAFDVKIKQVLLRNPRMDAHNVGYQMDIAAGPGKPWKNAVLSRRSFGLDNFSLETNVVQRSWSSGADPVQAKAPAQIQKTFIRSSGRVWCWAKDQEAATEALKNALFLSMDNIQNAANALKSTVAEASCEPLELKAKLYRAVKSPRP